MGMNETTQKGVESEAKGESEGTPARRECGEECGAPTLHQLV